MLRGTASVYSGVVISLFFFSLLMFVIFASRYLYVFLPSSFSFVGQDLVDFCVAMCVVQDLMRFYLVNLGQITCISI